jgi:hypothetical protein
LEVESGQISQLKWWKMWILNANYRNPPKINVTVGDGVWWKSVLVASWRNHCSVYSKSSHIQHWMIWKALLAGNCVRGPLYFTVPQMVVLSTGISEFGH